jgi:hypothetical protein
LRFDRRQTKRLYPFPTIARCSILPDAVDRADPCNRAASPRGERGQINHDGHSTRRNVGEECRPINLVARRDDAEVGRGDAPDDLTVIAHARGRRVRTERASGTKVNQAVRRPLRLPHDRVLRAGALIRDAHDRPVVGDGKPLAEGVAGDGPQVSRVGLAGVPDERARAACSARGAVAGPGLDARRAAAAPMMTSSLLPTLAVIAS